VEKWVDSGEDNFSLTAENLAKWVWQYLQSRPEGQRLIFLVDEVGQFIGGETHLMLNLQTIAEQLGTVCKGRAWVAVTTQEDLDAVLGDKTSGKQNDFSKIQGRFRTRLSLSSNNVDEVIKTRLLEKREAALPELAAAYSGKQDILKNQLSFVDTGATFNTYTGEDDFSACYPFAAYQFALVQKVFESIRLTGATGRHLSQGERSTLDAFQSAAKRVGDAEIGALVGFDSFYPAVEGFLDTSVKRTIERTTENHSLKPFDSTLLKVLFLIRYIDELPGKVDNLLVLLTDEIDEDRVTLRQDIEASLTRLEAETLIARNGDRYFFLTNEERDIGREIKNNEIPSGQEARMLGDILFRDVLDDSRKYTYKKTGRDFEYSRSCDDHVVGNRVEGSLEIAVITPLHDNYAELCDDGRCILQTQERRLSVRLPDDTELGRELRTWLQTDKYISNRNSGTLEPTTERILRDRAEENRARRKRLVETMKGLLEGASYFASGQMVEVKSSDAKTALGEAMDYLIGNAYSKMGLITHLTPDPRPEIQTILRADDVQAEMLNGEGEEGNVGALNDLREYLRLAEQGAKRVVLAELVEKRYGMPPYGWPELEVVLLVARLAAVREIDLIVNAATLPLDKAYDHIISVRSQRNVIISRRANADAALIKSAQQLGKTLFNATGPNTEAELFAHLKDRLVSWYEKLKEYETRIEATACPGAEDLSAGTDLLRPLVGESDSLRFLKSFTGSEKDLLDFSEDYQDVHQFFQSQYSTWQQLGGALTQLSPNRRQLSAHADAGPALARLDAIHKMPRPYGNLHEVAGLREVATVANNQLIETARKPVLAVLQQLQAQLEGELNRVGADDALRKQTLADFDLLRRDAESQSSIAHIEQAGHEAENVLEQALQRIEQAQAAKAKTVQETGGAAAPPVAPPKPRRILRAADAWRGGFIETTADIDTYLDDLRKRLQAIVDANERVQLK
jgi:hypothetical protein